MMTLYRLVIVPIAALVVLALLPIHRKVRATIGLRLKARPWPDWIGTKPTLWIHCASGEFEYAKPLIKEWRGLHPDWKIYVTYFSPTFRRVVEGHPGVDACGPLPLDLPGPMRAFVKKLNPKLVAVARTDLWPEMTATCEHLRIPVVLFSATRAPLKIWERLFPSVLRWRYQGARQIYTVSASDKSELERLHLDRPLLALGDTRYDQVIARLENPKPLPLSFDSQRPVFICGSTWAPDEKVILAATAELVRQRKLALILVPHEPSEAHLKGLEKQLRQLQIPSSRLSTITTWTGSHVLLVDRLGILAELYGKADIAFVGGSFVKTVHSVMEPLAAGLVTLIGPRHRNNREAVEFQMENLAPGIQMVNSVPDSQAMEMFLNACLFHADREKWKPRIQGAVRARSTATTKVAAAMNDLLRQEPTAL